MTVVVVIVLLRAHGAWVTSSLRLSLQVVRRKIVQEVHSDYVRF